ncbi:NAD(P)-dependent oxidoreductase [Alkalicoccobacillus plakortidis]|uniref:precorrin-2 dehydrogenase n=1 Tax=Alkalicoccobacillus plakortidis TaxID=444060 RepID=A0ABT0XPB6_9BACI|nr:NAD(P)-dependent oxidoreductase [Alkalicoccobacillus plakortidis]MCM2677748.1 hypothetical protein [Alkalicoccobacillus plakortidis]
MTERIPLMVNIQGKSVFCIGGGKVASKRIPLLIKGGANVIVISPTLHEELEVYMSDFHWEKRELHEAESFNADLLFIATNNQQLNDDLLRMVREGQWVYAAHNAEKSDFHFPAVLHEPPITLTISTGGAYPAYLPKLKQILKETLQNEHILDDLTYLSEVRINIANSSLTLEQKTSLLRACATDEFLRHPERAKLLEQWKEEVLVSKQ